jgi:hypothetical protein
MYKYKNKNTVGQRANTQSQNLISSVQAKVNASVMKYRTACKALGQLSWYVCENVGWCTSLLALAPEDIHPLKDGEEGQSEGHRMLSWI